MMSSKLKTDLNGMRAQGKIQFRHEKAQIADPVITEGGQCDADQTKKFCVLMRGFFKFCNFAPAPFYSF